MIQGLAYFPGIQQIVGCSLVCSHGINPASIVLTIAPQPDFEAAGGTLTIFDGNSSLEFPGCKVDRHSLERNAAGLIWRLTILDRRWKWAWGQISGSYNLANDDGSFRSDTEMSPQNLAALCLNALGETGYSVGKLPNTARPLVEWNFERPAEALTQLCDELGCRVVLRLDNTVSIEVVGQGNPLPTDGVADNSLTIDPPEQPDQMAVACGRDRFQVDFPLQAVGLNSDNTWVPINQLSYRPAAGWSTVDVPYFTVVAPQDRPRAKATVFRCYQIVVPAIVPDYGPVTSLAQIVPIEQEQVETTSGHQQSGRAGGEQAGADLWQLLSEHRGAGEQLPAPGDQPTGLREHAARVQAGLYDRREPGNRDVCRLRVFQCRRFWSGPALRFDIYRRNALPARCLLGQRCQHARAVRYTRVRNYGQQFDTPTRYLAHEEIVLTHVPVYGQNYSVQSVTTNADDVNDQCDYYLDAAEQTYQTTYPQTIRYVGLRGDIELDGAIQQIVFEVGPSGCTTTASRNDEQVHKYPSYQRAPCARRAGHRSSVAGSKQAGRDAAEYQSAPASKGLDDAAHVTAGRDPLAAAGQPERFHDPRFRLSARCRHRLGCHGPAHLQRRPTQWRCVGQLPVQRAGDGRCRCRRFRHARLSMPGDLGHRSHRARGTRGVQAADIGR